MLYERCGQIIEMLIHSQKPITIGWMAQKLSVSPRTVRSDLDVIDQWLKEHSLDLTVRVSGIGVFLKDPEGKIAALLKKRGGDGYVMSSKERVKAITGWLLAERTTTSIVEIAEQLDVSSATISNDLKKVRSWMEKNGIQMVSKPHMGICVRDTENNIRRGCIMILREMLETSTNQQTLISARFVQAEQAMEKYQMNSFRETLEMWREQILIVIQALQESAQVKISNNGFCAMFLYLLTAWTRIRKGHFISTKENTYSHIKIQEGFDGGKIHNLIKKETGMDISKDEMFMIHAEWMSLRKFGASHEINVESVLIAKELIEEVKDSLELEFEEGEDTVMELATHINVMRYRLFLDIPAEHNPVLKEIEETFPDVCEVVREKLWSIMRGRLGEISREVCNHEAVYIAMYIVACMMKNPLEGTQKKDIIIVCNSTIATSKILESRLKSLFDNINVVKTISYNEFVNASELPDCDLVISTMPLESSKYQCITVNPLLKLEDVNRLMKIFMLRMQKVDINKYISATINIAARSLELKPEERIKLSIELARNINEEVNGLDNRKKPELKTLLEESLIAVNVKAKNCYEAIQAAGELLKSRGYIEQRHIDEMIRIKKKLGGYMVIDKGVALPHLLAPELSGPCMSMITLDKPVKFGHSDNDPVSLVIMLVSNNNTVHIKVLEELVDLLGDAEKRKEIDEAEHIYEVLEVINSCQRRCEETEELPLN